MIFKELHEAYGHIKFIDYNHSYIDMINNKRLISVTTLIKQFIKPFDTEFHSKRMADKPKEKRTQEQLKLQWKKDGVLGATAGTMLHNYLENLWNNKVFEIDYSVLPKMNTVDFIPFHGKVSRLIEMADQFHNENKNLIPVKTELIVGNEKIAGQVDLLAYDTEIDGYVIVDYKSDRRMNYKSFFGNKFLNKLSHLDECEINKYSLQLCIYKELLKKVVDIKDMYVVWFNVKNDTYKKIKLKNLDIETRSILSSI